MAIVAAISVLVSVFLAASAQGIAVFMVFGAGPGRRAARADRRGARLAQRWMRIADVVAVALPFEALYQAGLYLIATDASGLHAARRSSWARSAAPMRPEPGLVVFSARLHRRSVLAVAAFARDFGAAATS